MDTPARHPAALAGKPSCCRSSPCSCCRSRPAPRSTPMKAAREAGATPTGPRPAACRDPGAEPEARVLVMSGRTGGWKGVFSVHSWVVLKPENGKSWRRYDVVGWGNPVRINGWAPDGLWFGNKPQVVLDLHGAAATEGDPEDRGRDQGAINTPMPATIASGPGRTATPSSPPCCAPSPRPKRSCRRTRSAATSAPALCRPDRQRHRRRGEPVGRRRRQARLGRGRGDEFPRPRRRPRPAQSRHQAAGLRPHRLAAADRDRRAGAIAIRFTCELHRR